MLKWGKDGRLLTHSASTYQIPTLGDAVAAFGASGGEVPLPCPATPEAILAAIRVRLAGASAVSAKAAEQRAGKLVSRFREVARNSVPRWPTALS